MSTTWTARATIDQLCQERKAVLRFDLCGNSFSTEGSYLQQQPHERGCPEQKSSSVWESEHNLGYFQNRRGTTLLVGSLISYLKEAAAKEAFQ
jgi:hypothetical protein